MSEEIVKRPRCPKCRGCMVFTFAFRGAEFACVPCWETKPFMCDRDPFPAAEEDRLKALWAGDLQWIGLRMGGGICNEHNTPACEVCAPKDYEPKYFPIKRYLAARKTEEEEVASRADEPRPVEASAS